MIHEHRTSNSQTVDLTGRHGSAIVSHAAINKTVSGRV